MSDPDRKLVSEYSETLARAGSITAHDELLSFIHAGAETLDAGRLATMRLLARGQIHMELAFTLLDSAKSIVTTHLLHRASFARAGVALDFIVPNLEPDTVAYYLNTRPVPTAIVALHMIGRDRLAIMLAANSPTRSGIRGNRGGYYNCIWLDGLQKWLADAMGAFAHTAGGREVDMSLAEKSLKSIGAAVLYLLSGSRPKHVIFIPHKQLHVLPLHMISVGDVYLHDMVDSISYASSLGELIFGTVEHTDRGETSAGRQASYVSVLDENAGLGGVALERRIVAAYATQLGLQGVRVDVLTDIEQFAQPDRRCVWLNWNSHGVSDASSWGGSYLELGDREFRAATIATQWQFDLRPVVVLAACQSAIDVSGSSVVDEYCGLDLAFRVAGARAVVASAWKVSDPVAALTSAILPAWWFQGRMHPSVSLTALQRALRTGTWKQFLLRNEQLKLLPPDEADAVHDAQEPLRRLPDDVFSPPRLWATFRAHGG